MPTYTLEITLLSDTAFSMGAGISGLVDSEIQHDELGLPTLSGRAIKGLLTTACSEILYSLGETDNGKWYQSALKLFGKHGETIGDEGELFIGDASIAPDLRAFLMANSTKRPSRLEIIEALTDIRRQTSMNEFGAPKDETLRAVRVLLRGLTLYAPLNFAQEPMKEEKALLAACVMGIKRAGLGRNRGKGKIKIEISNRALVSNHFAETSNEMVNQVTGQWFAHFEKEITQ